MKARRLRIWLPYIVSLFTGVCGFLGKDLYEHLMRKRLMQQEAAVQLQEFENLLTESTSYYEGQRYMVSRLASLLEAKYGDEVPFHLGYDEAFARYCGRMDQEQKDLLRLIRSGTQNSMQRLNQELRTWAESHSARIMFGRSTEAAGAFDLQLDTLRLHLNQWFDKYESLFKPDTCRSLVYMDDEKAHGVAFPRNLHPALARLLAEVGKRLAR